jgi:hypothetical protein
MSEIAAPPFGERIQIFLATRKYYTWKDLRDALFEGDLSALIDAWVDDYLPPPVRQVCEDTWPPDVVQLYLLRRLLRQTASLHQQTTAVLQQLT